MEPATTDRAVTLVEHTSFAISDRAGDMLPGSYHGFFVADTRVLSRLVLRLDGERLEPRTLSTQNPGYNPIGYHLGTVWPHENSLIADGMARLGRADAAARVIDALLDAAVADPLARLPELFAGFDRASTVDLVPYPTACAPQAWATGAIFQIVETLLSVRSADRPAAWSKLRMLGIARQWTTAPS